MTAPEIDPTFADEREAEAWTRFLAAAITRTSMLDRAEMAADMALDAYRARRAKLDAWKTDGQAAGYREDKS